MPITREMKILKVLPVSGKVRKEGATPHAQFMLDVVLVLEDRSEKRHSIKRNLRRRVVETLGHLPFESTAEETPYSVQLDENGDIAGFGTRFSLVGGPRVDFTL